jgi:valyl-tRNA synthetase
MSSTTLQDVPCRFERMRGRHVCGSREPDHAGIATQMVVERQLMERQEPARRVMGREKLGRSGGIIVNQLKRLGAS